MKASGPRPSYATALVLRALATGHHYGFGVMDATGLPSGTVYPILRRLDREGLVTSRWEDAEVARRAQRPSRRYYDIAPAGLEALDALSDRYRQLARSGAHAARTRKPALGTS